MKNKIDISKLSNEDLFYYFTHDYKDKDYGSVVALLPYAVMWDCDKAYSILRRVVDEGKVLYAYYPAFDTTDVTDMEFVGGIMDGCLYVK